MKEKLWRIWFWFSQIVSVIGLISVLDDLQLWVKAVRRLISALHRWAPSLATLVEDLRDILHGVTEVWRQVMHPLLDLLFGWMPFDVPLIVRELIVVAIFVTTGWVRAANLWSKASRDRRDALERIFKKYGVPRDVRQTVGGSTVYVCKDFHRHLSDEKSYFAKHASTLKRALGDRVDAFSREVRSDRDVQLGERSVRWALLWERPLKIFVAVSAAVVLVLVVADVVIFEGRG